MRAQLLAFKNRSFANFFTGSLISFFGAGLQLLASTWYVHSVTGSSKAVAYLWLSMVASSPILLIYSGAFIDRFSRQRLLMALSAIRGFLILLIPLSIFMGTFSLWQLYAMAFINGIGFNISFPAEKALVHEMMPGKELLAANSLIEVSIQVGMFVSAALSGVLYGAVGLSGVLIINAFTFFIGAWFFGRIAATHRSAPAHKEEKYLEAVWSGWRYLFDRPYLFAFCVIAFIPTAVTVASNVVTPAYVNSVLGKGVISYGFIDGIYGAGAFLSGAASALLARFSRGTSVVLLIVASLITLLAIPATYSLGGAILLYFLFGYANTSLRIIFSTILMEIAPKEYMGRISSASLLTSNLFQVLSFFVVGYLADNFSVMAGYYYLAFLMVPVFAGFLMIGKRLGLFAPSSIKLRTAEE